MNFQLTLVFVVSTLSGISASTHLRINAFTHSAFSFLYVQSFVALTLRRNYAFIGFFMNYKGYKDLKVFQLSYKLAMEIFEITKSFPKDEKYSLTDQIRRSSRSIPANISEAWKKRIYPKMFISKIIDAAGEAGETEVWLEFARDAGYLVKGKYDELVSGYGEVNRML